MGEKLSDAVSAFSKRFARFSKTTQERTVPKRDDEFLQEKINAGEAGRREAVSRTYRVFKDPFGVLGTSSNRAHALHEDEQNLLRAYRLFKAVKEAAESKGDKETFVSSFSIESPLPKKNAYTFGGEFIYLSCWLRFEQGATDFIPVLKEENNSWQLTFASSSIHRYERADSELIKMVKECFYS